MVTVVTESELRHCVTADAEALAIVEDGFARLGRGEATIPPIMGLEIPEKNGAADVKAAYVSGWEAFAIKISTRFFDNPRRGVPSGSGMMTLLDADTGQPRAILLDNGYLTTVRTALAGALAAKYLAPQRVATVGVIGAGSQARWQVAALRLVRPFDRVVVYGRDAERATRYVQEMADGLGVPVEAVDSAEALAQASDVIVTTTPATKPLLEGGWLRPGTHVSAMGSDAAHKNELAPSVFAVADVVACDLRDQCLQRGELRHAVAAGTVTQDHPAVELGALVNGGAPGRSDDQQITVCDLTGVGIQDTAIARYALRCVVAAGLGQEIG